MMLTQNQETKINALRGRAIVIGVICCILAGVGGAVNGIFSEDTSLLTGIWQPFFVAFILCFGLAASNLALVMLHHLCGGAWSYTLQRIAEAGARTLPFFGLMSVVVLGGAVFFTDIYPWMDQARIDAHPIIAEKTALLNPTAYVAFTAVFFVVLIGLSLAFNSWSKKLDETGDVKNITKMKRFAAPGLILYVLFMTLAATMWTMSLEPEWFSTIYGAWMISGYALTIVAFNIIVLSYLDKEPPIVEKVTTRTYHHLGNYLLGFTIFWTYVSFSQFLIIWNGNLPEEIGWYLHRSGNALNILTVALMAFHWLVPMLILLIRRNKTQLQILRKIAFYILAVRILDMYWNLVPSFEGHASTLNLFMLLLVALASLGVAGVWLFFFLGELKKRPLLPLHDPREELMFLKDIHGHA